MAQGHKIFSRLSIKVLWGLGLWFGTVASATACRSSSSNVSTANPVIHIYPNFIEPSLAEDTAVSVLKLDHQGFQDFQQKDPIQGLAPVASLQTSQLGADTPGLFIQLRGADPGQTPVQIMGVSIADPSAGDRFDFSTLPLPIVDYLEIEHFSAQSGVSGSVQIEPRRGQGASSYQGRVEGGSFKDRSVSLESQGASKTHHYFVTGSMAGVGDGSLRNKRLGNETADRSRQRSLALRLGTTFHSGWESDLYASYHSTAVKLNEITGPLPINSPDHLTQQQGIFISRNHFETFNKRWNHTLSLSSVTHRRDTLIKDQPYFSVGDTFGALYENELVLNSDSLHILKPFMGVKTDRVHADRVGFKPRQTWQGGVIYQRAVSQKVTLDLGSQLEKAAPSVLQKAFYGQLRTQVHPSLTLWIRTGTGFQLPTLTALYASSPFMVSNPVLKPLTSRQTDMGFAFNPCDALAVSMSYFMLDIKNFITARSLPGGKYQYVNEDQRRTQGIETTFQLNPFKTQTKTFLCQSLKLRGGYTYLDARNLQRQQPPLRLARHVFTGGMDVSLTKQWQLFSEGRWQSTTTDFDFSAGQRVRLPAQGSVRAGAVYKVDSRLDVTLRMENLLNSALESVYGYPQRGFGVFIGVIFRDGPSDSSPSKSSPDIGN